MNIIFTVCNRFTLANAMVLAESVKRYQTDSVFYLCLVDNIKIQDISPEINILNVREIDIPGWEGMCKRYFDFELVAASRPWFAKFLTNQGEKKLETITFFAPSTLLLDKPVSLPQDRDLMLTPNIAAPITENPGLDDKRILNVGMFNSGSWTLRLNETTINFLEWWSFRTLDRAKFDLCNGMCMDQLWLNYAPVWIPKTHVIRSGAWHYGLRSIPGHRLIVDDKQYFVGGQKLVSADFTGLACFDPVWSDHVGLLSSSSAFKKLYREYEKRVAGFASLTRHESGEGYGLVANISKHRLVTKRIVLVLNSAVNFINKV